jgi:hypothetical protein
MGVAASYTIQAILMARTPTTGTDTMHNTNNILMTGRPMGNITRVHIKSKGEGKGKGRGKGKSRRWRELKQ